MAKRWTKAECVKAALMRRQGYSDAVTAKAIGRPKRATRAKLQRMGIPQPLDNVWQMLHDRD
jgi:hypothetical protein